MGDNGPTARGSFSCKGHERCYGGSSLVTPSLDIYHPSK